MTETNNLVECEWCNTEKDEDQYDGADIVCNECVNSFGSNCNNCGELIHEDDVHFYIQDNVLCESCYTNYYFYCAGCDYVYHNDNYGYDDMCTDCEGEQCDCGDPDCSGSSGEYHVGIRDWGDAPDLLFWNKADNGIGYDYNYTPRPDTYYMGMEIEVEGHVKDIIGPLMTEYPFTSHMWATTDATLGTQGVEIVTHPHTYEAWMKTFPWDEWTKKIHNMVPNQEVYSTNGIHIHVSRTAFANHKGKVLASHLYKFMQFIQINEDAIQFLAGRTGNTYCQWEQQRDAVSRLDDAKTDTSCDSFERYRPVNTQNRETIELRFFDGRTDPDFMKRSIQFVHSLVEFTRRGNAKSKRTWDDYTRYVRGLALKYPELVAYLSKEKDNLMLHAIYAVDKYTNHVLPNVKKDIKRKREELEQIRLDDIRIEQERQDRLDSPPECDCEYCEQDRTDALVQGAREEFNIPTPYDHL